MQGDTVHIDPLPLASADWSDADFLPNISTYTVPAGCNDGNSDYLYPKRDMAGSGYSRIPCSCDVSFAKAALKERITALAVTDVSGVSDSVNESWVSASDVNTCYAMSYAMASRSRDADGNRVVSLSGILAYRPARKYTVAAIKDSWESWESDGYPSDFYDSRGCDGTTATVYENDVVREDDIRFLYWALYNTSRGYRSGSSVLGNQYLYSTQYSNSFFNPVSSLSYDTVTGPYYAVSVTTGTGDYASSTGTTTTGSDTETTSTVSDVNIGSATTFSFSCEQRYSYEKNDYYSSYDIQDGERVPDGTHQGSVTDETASAGNYSYRVLPSSPLAVRSSYSPYLSSNSFLAVSYSITVTKEIIGDTSSNVTDTYSGHEFTSITSVPYSGNSGLPYIIDKIKTETGIELASDDLRGSCFDAAKSLVSNVSPSFTCSTNSTTGGWGCRTKETKSVKLSISASAEIRSVYIEFDWPHTLDKLDWTKASETLATRPS